MKQSEKGTVNQIEYCLEVKLDVYRYNNWIDITGDFSKRGFKSAMGTELTKR